jgi:putative redox protein
MKEMVVTWQDGMSFTAETLSGHSLLLDASPRVGGENKGPRPTELVLAGLGSCTGMDVVSILRKMRQNWDRFEIVLTHTAREEHPRVFTSVQIQYRIWGEVNPDRFVRAIVLSAEQYCTVSAMLKAAGVAITYTCEVNGTPVPVTSAPVQ